MCMCNENDFMVCPVWVVEANSGPVLSTTNANMTPQSPVLPRKNTKQKNHYCLFGCILYGTFSHSPPPASPVCLSVCQNELNPVWLLWCCSVLPAETSIQTDMSTERRGVIERPRQTRSKRLDHLSFSLDSWNSESPRGWAFTHTHRHRVDIISPTWRHLCLRQLFRIIYAVSITIYWRAREEWRSECGFQTEKEISWINTKE